MEYKLKRPLKIVGISKPHTVFGEMASRSILSASS